MPSIRPLLFQLQSSSPDPHLRIETRSGVLYLVRPVYSSTGRVSQALALDEFGTLLWCRANDLSADLDRPFWALCRLDNPLRALTEDWPQEYSRLRALESPQESTCAEH